MGLNCAEWSGNGWKCGKHKKKEKRKMAWYKDWKKRRKHFIKTKTLVVENEVICFIL